MRRILIVDEDTAVLRLLRVKLNAAGYETSQARDGTEALNLVQEVQPDVVIIEPILPDMAGLELLSGIRSAHESAPIILVLSGQISDQDIATALTAGADDYVTKPFSPQGLLERIRVNLIRDGLGASTRDGGSS